MKLTENLEFIMPEFEIKLKIKGKSAKSFAVESSQDAAIVAKYCFDADHIEWIESFIVISLNRANKVRGFYKVSSGGITATVADPRVIFQFALLSNATGLILAHNHPSGNLTPSRQDEAFTEKIKDAGRLLDINIVDHIICTVDGYYSFADEGKL